MKGYLGQYRLEDDGTGHVKSTKVREFGKFSGKGEIEAVVVDDEPVTFTTPMRGLVRVSGMPTRIIPKPDASLRSSRGKASKAIGKEWQYTPGRTVRASSFAPDQVPNNSAYHLYRREGSAGNHHDHTERVATIRGNADATDGIEATSAAPGIGFA